MFVFAIILAKGSYVSFISGMVTPNPFDQMVTGSMLGGYTATIKSTPPASHLYVTAGVQPYAGFYHAVEVKLFYTAT